jgi:hypothetical protein
MRTLRCFLMAALFLLPANFPISALAQAQAASDKDLNLRAYVNLLRADIKAKRVSLITEIMQFNDAEAAAFWPIFREYDGELTKIGDGRLQIIAEYVKNYENMTDAKADELMSRALELEKQRAELKKKYFDKMKMAMSAVTAARFFQVENQIQQIVDLQISANLPTMQQASK